VCRSLDHSLGRLANTWGLDYLRYSDDMYFFGAKNFRYRVFKNYVRPIISENGFRIHNRKTKYCPLGRPRFTLGLATHGDKPALSKDTRRRYRAAFFKASRDLKWARENLERLAGMGEWHRAVYGQDEMYREYQKIINNVREIKLHERYAI
jgi:hypothetical protein